MISSARRECDALRIMNAHPSLQEGQGRGWVDRVQSEPINSNHTLSQSNPVLSARNDQLFGTQQLSALIDAQQVNTLRKISAVK